MKTSLTIKCTKIQTTCNQTPTRPDFKWFKTKFRQDYNNMKQSNRTHCTMQQMHTWKQDKYGTRLQRNPVNINMNKSNNTAIRNGHMQVQLQHVQSGASDSDMYIHIQQRRQQYIRTGHGTRSNQTAICIYICYRGDDKNLWPENHTHEHIWKQALEVTEHSIVRTKSNEFKHRSWGNVLQQMDQQIMVNKSANEWYIEQVVGSKERNKFKYI